MQAPTTIKRPRGGRLLLALLAALCCGTGRTAESKIAFHIPAGNASLQINEFGLQANLQLLGDFKLMSRFTTNALYGKFTAREALERMLAGTGLRYRFIDEETLNILAKESATADAGPPLEPSVSTIDEITVTGTHIRGQSPIGSELISLDREAIKRTGRATVADVIRTLPQNFNGGPTQDTREIGRETRTNSGMGVSMNLRGLGPGETLVLVNGRRLAPGGSEGAFIDILSIPLAAVDRIDILPDSGSALYGTDAIGGVINIVLRRNYSGFESEARAGTATQGAPGEYRFGQVLGSQSDRSSGLLAFEYYRRDALPTADRELAHSDLRKFGGENFDVLQGNPGTIFAGERYWAIPHGQDGENLTQQDFTQDTANLEDRYRSADLTPRQRRWSLLGTAQFQLSDNAGLFADALYSQRQPQQKLPGLRLSLPIDSRNPFYVNPTGGADPVIVMYDFVDDFGPLVGEAVINTSNFALGANVNARRGWHLSTYAGYAREELTSHQTGMVNIAALTAALMSPNRSTAFNPFGDGSHTNPALIAQLRSDGTFNAKSDMASFNVGADGPLLELPSGEVKLAVGFDRRQQTFDAELRDVNSAAFISPPLKRTVNSLFGELLVPLANPDWQRRGLHELSLSAALGHESYTHIGDTTAPKIGLRWSPVAGLLSRATWTRSFRAPNLADQFEGNNGSQIYLLSDNTVTSGMTSALIWFGKNSQLRPESAQSWTLGADLTGEWLRGWSIGMTYFDVELENQFSEHEFSSNLLIDSRNASLVTRNPTAEQRAAICSHSHFGGLPDDCRAASIGAIVDLRLSNSAFMETDGLDLNLRREIDSGIGHFTVDILGTYVFRYAERETPDARLQEQVNTQHNPLHLRVRGALSWQRRGFGMAAALNYSGSYRDTAGQPNQPVRSVGAWTTADLQLSYRRDDPGASWLANTGITLNMENVFDRSPPFLNNHLGLGYDAENADLDGRILSVEFSKRW